MRTGQHDSVSRIQPCRIGKVGAFIRRKGEIADDVPVDVLQHRGVGFRRHEPIRLAVGLPCATRIALDDQKS